MSVISILLWALHSKLTQKFGRQCICQSINIGTFLTFLIIKNVALGVYLNFFFKNIFWHQRSLLYPIRQKHFFLYEVFRFCIVIYVKFSKLKSRIISDGWQYSLSLENMPKLFTFSNYTNFCSFYKQLVHKTNALDELKRKQSQFNHETVERRRKLRSIYWEGTGYNTLFQLEDDNRYLH